MKKKKQKGLKFTREQFNKILQLYNVQPWLQKKEDELFDLLGLCSNIAEQGLIFDLLIKFKYLTSSDISEYYEKIVEQVVESWKLDPNETQIVAISCDDNPDSGQAILWFLKYYLVKYSLSGFKLLNIFWKAIKHVEQRPNIVLVDEFAGTGTTVINRYKWLRNSIPAKYEYNIFVCIIASMLNAKNNIEDHGIELFTPLVLQKGIKHNYEGKKRKKAYRNMYKLELKLAEEVEDIRLPNLGWGFAEALYAQQYANAPNSVFPIFWWPKLNDGSIRNTILRRLMSD